MKKLIITFALLFIITSIKSQPAPCWWTPSWDWLITTNTNWQYYNGSLFVDMGTPFQNANPTSSLTKIIDASDYTTSKGWVLFSKDFGCVGAPVTNQLPFFSLYNKFTGVIRYFFYNANSSSSTINKSLVTMEWYNNQKTTSLFNHTNLYNETNDKFPKTTDQSLYPVNIGNYAGGGAWYIADFTAHFDQNTGRGLNGLDDLTKTGADYKLLLKIYQVSNSNVTLNGTFQFNTEVSSFAQSPSPSVISSGTNPTYQLLSDAKKFLGKVPSESDLKNIYTQFDAQIATLNASPVIKGGIKGALADVQAVFQNNTFRNVLTTAASFAPPAGQIVSGAMALMDLFIDKPTQSTSSGGPTFTYMAPTVSRGTIELNGTITTTGNQKDFTTQLPGVNHKYISGNVVYSGLPYYDCPLGVLNLESEPLLQKRSHLKTMAFSQTTYFGEFRVANYPLANMMNLSYCGLNTAHLINPNGTYAWTTIRSQYFKEELDYYKVDDNVKIAINDASGLNLEEIQYALVVELERDVNGNVIFDALKESVVFNEPPLGDYQGCILGGDYNYGNPVNNQLIYNLVPQSTNITQTYDNPILDQIKKGIYIVSEIKGDKVSKYCTPFIPANQFKGTTIRAPKGSKIILKVLARLRPIDSQYEQTPVIITSSYELKTNSTKIETDPIDNYYQNNCYQESLATDFNLIYNGNFTIPGNDQNGQYVNGMINGYRTITTSGNINIAASNSNYFSPTQKVTFAPYTKLTTTSVNSNFRAYIDPNQIVGGCINGQSSIMINHYFTNCDNDPTHRIANNQLNNNSNQDEELYEQTRYNDLKLYCFPNPNNGKFKLFFNQNITKGTIRITSVLGEEIFNSNTDEGSVFDIDITDKIKQGTYIVTFSNKNFNLNAKFIVLE